jgi:hypothetical protein
MHAVTFFAICFLFWSSICEAQLANFFSSEDIADIGKKSLAALKSPKSAKDAYFATRILSASNTKYTCDCKTLASYLKGKPSSYDIFYGVSSSQSCGCDSPISNSFQNAILTDLKVWINIGS